MSSRFAITATFLASLGLSLCLSACDGPAAASLVQNEPVCPDFRIGAAGTKMHGGLRQPLQVKVLDGRTTVATVTVLGLQADDSDPTRFLLPDGNDDYTVEWSQCPNERAPMPVDADSKHSNGAPKFFCGETKPFKTEKLTTKKGDETTRRISVPVPPIPACWTDEPADAPAPSASASASAAPSAEPPVVEAPSASASAAAMPSASAAPSASASAASATSAAPASSARKP